ncbi:Part of AAA domain-containing protein [Frankia canadensis]|uniref:Part of AAA domain-containing protein n=1 Tax=Frankia canadensis TaxID=1836972 RepID=A0A2I2KQ06_9ACTN|nr:ATP-binding protein [Frankia canadensis]SNQ47739.1 Part of AAA domain-containing protein [Frankia canadensis]SOU55029.1 Part of AAA domain-containing protein [Frankia canadensis]
MATTETDPAAILRFWTSVEMFSPPPVQAVDRRRRVYRPAPDQLLPWDPRHELARVRRPPDQVWRHVVYLGVFALEAVHDRLAEVYGAEDDSYDARPAGESALAAFIVSGIGRPQPDTLTLSCCAWSTAQAVTRRSASPDWAADFDAATAGFSDEFLRVLLPFLEHEQTCAACRRGDVTACVEDGIAGDRLPPPITLDGLRNCRDAVAAATGAGDLFPCTEIRVASTLVSTRTAESASAADTHDFLNSFVLADLRRVARAAGATRPTGALGSYLRPNAALDIGRRLDVRERLDVVLDATRPARVPAGRWPSPPEHPLALSQQLAVNSILDMVDGDGGIFAVNGPPGTGKTTMLRDIVAALVVERAHRLAALTAPADAFSGEKRRWKTGEYTRVAHVWAPSLTGFEIVVASANNGAVENITNEIPARDAIGDGWSAEATALDYFPAVAARLLGARPQTRTPTPTPMPVPVPGGAARAGGETETDTDVDADPEVAAGETEAAWGLVAARLGNKRNRTRFVSDCWYGTQGASADSDGAGLLATLKSYEKGSPPTSWQAETARFRQAYEAVTSLGADREQAFVLLGRRDQAEQELPAATAAAHDARAAGARARADADQAASLLDQWQQERARLVAVRVEHRQFRPGLLDRLFSRATVRQWRDRDAELADQVAAAERAVDAARRSSRHLTDAAADAADISARADEHARRRAMLLTELTGEVDRVRAQLGDVVPDAQWWTARTRRERAAPWTDPRWNQARSELLFAALRLHKQFLRHVPTQMRQNLQAAMDVVGGTAPGELRSEDAIEAWRSLFFVVPVVSTTFASVGRVFPQLGPQTLGWLLIDEAGQATPQIAAGALWRARNVIAVGDPLQLEPVSSLPLRIQQMLRQAHGVDEEWVPARTSVQRLADRLNPLGTWLPDEEGPVWVGSPLVVHRRCDQPMFDLVNELVYDGLMIDATGSDAADRFTRRYPHLPASKWIDVRATEAHGHWVPEEGRRLEQILGALARLNVPFSEVMVIAPFRDIALALRPYAERYPGLVAGTVHTAQGKQADIVIMVLGGAPDRPGAKRWAASRPNLFNVALSRAKRRVYVVGDRQAWAQQRYFAQLADSLPYDEPR